MKNKTKIILLIAAAVIAAVASISVITVFNRGGKEPVGDEEETVEKKSAFDFKVYGELKTIRAMLSLLDLSNATFNCAMSALEIHLSGDYEDGLAKLEALYTEANNEEKPHIGMLLIQQYLNLGKVNRAEKVAKVLLTDFSDTGFPHLARAYIDITNERIVPAFRAIEESFEAGEKNERLFLWFNAFSMFNGTDAQERKITGWFKKYREMCPENKALLFSVFSYQMLHQRDATPESLKEFDRAGGDKELLIGVLDTFARDCYFRGEIIKGRDVLSKAVRIAPGNTRALISYAYYLTVTGNARESLSYLNNALGQTRETAIKGEIYRRLAAAYRELDEREKMLEAGRKALALDPDSPWSYVSLAESYFYLDELDRAIEICNRGLALRDRIRISYPALVRMYDQVGDIYRRKQDFDRALEYFRKAAEEGGAYDKTYYRSFFRKYRAFNYETAALEEAKELIIKYPGNPYLYAIVAELCWNLEKYDDAIAFARRAIELGEKDGFKIKYTNLLIKIHLEKKEMEKARGIAEKAVTDFPHNPGSHSNFGLVYKETGEYEKALEKFQDALDLGGSDWYKEMPLKHMAEIYDKLGNTEKAVECYRERSELAPSQWTASDLARYLKEKGMYDEAVKAYRDAMKYTKDVSAVTGFYNEIAAIQMEQGKTDDAIRTAKDYIRHFPDDSGARYQLAGIYRQMGNYRDAESAYRRAIELSGKDVQKKLKYFNDLVTMLADEAGKHEAAIDAAERMIEIDPDHSKGYEYLAGIYISLRRYEWAGRTYERIAGRASGSEDWRLTRYLHLAGVNYARAGQKDRALGLLKKALESAPEDEKKDIERKIETVARGL